MTYLAIAIVCVFLFGSLVGFVASQTVNKVRIDRLTNEAAAAQLELAKAHDRRSQLAETLAQRNS